MDDLTTLGPAKTLLAAVTGYLDENYRTPGARERWALPEGLRLELHPATFYKVIGDPYAYPNIPYPFTEGIGLRLGLPVKVTPDLPDGTWRLVIVTEDVKLSGTL